MGASGWRQIDNENQNGEMGSDKSWYRGLTCHVNKWKWSSRKKALLFPLRTDFISSYSPPYPSRHGSLEPTAFSQTTSLRETKPSRAWDEIRERELEGEGVSFRSTLTVPLEHTVGSGGRTRIEVRELRLDFVESPCGNHADAAGNHCSPIDSQIQWWRLCLLFVMFSSSISRDSISCTGLFNNDTITVRSVSLIYGYAVTQSNFGPPLLSTSDIMDVKQLDWLHLYCRTLLIRDIAGCLSLPSKMIHTTLSLSAASIIKGQKKLLASVRPRVLVPIKRRQFWGKEWSPMSKSNTFAHYSLLRRFVVLERQSHLCLRQGQSLFAWTRGSISRKE